MSEKHQRIPIIEAVIDNRAERVIELIALGADLNEQDDTGYTALHYAAQNYLPEIIRLLLDSKAKVDLKDAYGNTPLHKAVFFSQGRGDVILMLLAAGADRELKNNSGISALDLAKKIANYSIEKFFNK